MKNIVLILFLSISLPVFADIDYSFNSSVSEIKKPNVIKNISGIDFILYSENIESTFSPFYKNQILYIHFMNKTYEIYTNEDMRNYSISLEEIECKIINNEYIISLNLGSNAPRGGGLGYKIIKYISVTTDGFMLINITKIPFDVYTESVSPVIVFNNQSKKYLIINKTLDNGQNLYFGYRIENSNSKIQISNAIITSVIDDNVRIRDLDSTTSKILAALNKGDMVHIIKYGKSEVINNGNFIWTYLYIPKIDMFGWIYGEYLYSRPGEK